MWGHSEVLNGAKQVHHRAGVLHLCRNAGGGESLGADRRGFLSPPGARFRPLALPRALQIFRYKGNKLRTFPPSSSLTGRPHTKAVPCFIICA